MTPPQPGIVVVDKPAGMTSHDVVSRCRRIFGTRKVGHAGTLDPMATGVLVVGLERATKILGLISGTSKSYTATIRLGRTTTTDDAEGQVVQDISVREVTDEAIAAGIARLRGTIFQRPSAVSAIKVGGKRAYTLAREGQQVVLAEREVRIERFDVLAIHRNGPFIDVDVEVDCSSGTYIRALARDLGAGLRAGGSGVGGHLIALRRTRVGGYGLDHASTLDGLAERPALSYTLDAACLLAFPRRDITEAQAVDAAHGRPLPALGVEGVQAATDPEGRVMALLEDRGGWTRSVVVIRPATLADGRMRPVDETARGAGCGSADDPDPPVGCNDEGMSQTPPVPAAGRIPIETLVGDSVVRVAVDATVADVAAVIAERGVGAVVIGADERPTALVSERDVVRVVASGQDPAAVPAGEVAARNLVWCDAGDTVDEAAIRMTDRGIRHLLVGRDEALVGIVSARDLLGVYATDAGRPD